MIMFHSFKKEDKENAYFKNLTNPKKGNKSIDVVLYRHMYI